MNVSKNNMWYSECAGGVLVRIKVIPSAQQNKIVGVVGDILKIKIAAPADKGRANDMLVLYMAKLLDMSKHEVRIRRGLNSVRKLVFVPLGVDRIKNLI